MVFVKPLVLDADKCLFYRLRNFIGSEVNQVAVIFQEGNERAVLIINFSLLVCLKISGGRSFHNLLGFLMELEDFLHISGLKNNKTDANENAEHGQLGQAEEKASHIFFMLFLPVLFLFYRFFMFHMINSLFL